MADTVSVDIGIAVSSPRATSALSLKKRHQKAGSGSIALYNPLPQWHYWEALSIASGRLNWHFWMLCLTLAAARPQLQAFKADKQEATPAAELEAAAPARTNSGVGRSDSATPPAVPPAPPAEPSSLDAPDSSKLPGDDAAAAATAAAQITQKALQASTPCGLT